MIFCHYIHKDNFPNSYISTASCVCDIINNLAPLSCILTYNGIMCQPCFCVPCSSTINITRYIKHKNDNPHMQLYQCRYWCVHRSTIQCIFDSSQQLGYSVYSVRLFWTSLLITYHDTNIVSWNVCEYIRVSLCHRTIWAKF